MNRGSPRGHSITADVGFLRFNEAPIHESGKLRIPTASRAIRNKLQ